MNIHICHAIFYVDIYRSVNIYMYIYIYLQAYISHISVHILQVKPFCANLEKMKISSKTHREPLKDSLFQHGSSSILEMMDPKFNTFADQRIRFLQRGCWSSLLPGATGLEKNSEDFCSPLVQLKLEICAIGAGYLKTVSASHPI